MDALEAIRKRRTVRSFTGALIPRADLETIVDAGRLAASGYNRQPWDFIVVTDRGMIEQAQDRRAMDGASWGDHCCRARSGDQVLAGGRLGRGAEHARGSHRARLRRMLARGIYPAAGEPVQGPLGVPDDKRLLTLVPIGVPVEWPTKEKKPLEQVLHWEKY